MKFRWVLLVALLTISFEGTYAAKVDVERKVQTALPGQSAQFMCRVPVPLQYCRVEIPGVRTLNLNKGIENNEVTYYGEGLDAGQCGFILRNVQDKNNGEVKCGLGIASEAQESIGSMTLIVAKAPKLPELDLSQGNDYLGVYKVDHTLQAQCIVRDGRPVANISWYLDNDPIDASELSMPTVIDLAKENLQSKVQNLTRRLRASDNGKFLTCRAYHAGYPNGMAETKRQLDIKYAPIPQHLPLEAFGYEIGKTGVINVTIEANPKPQIEWNIDGYKIREGHPDNSGRIQAEYTQDLGNGSYSVMLKIARIKKQDTEKEYILTAYNDMGTQDYRVRISTNPEPKGFEFGVASVIAIVIGVMLAILIVSLLIFAKVTGRWCFSGMSTNELIYRVAKREKLYKAKISNFAYCRPVGETKNLNESSDTESADVKPKEERRFLPPIKLTAFFKKNKDKIAAEEDPEARNMDTEANVETENENDKKEKESDEVDGVKDTKPNKKDVVYAELDLVSANLKPVVKSEDEKTEYAEIVYTPVEKEEMKEKEEKEKEKKSKVKEGKK